MIETVRKVSWRDELKVWGWYGEVRKMEQEGTFQYCRHGMENGVSEEVDKAFRDLEKAANKSNRNLASLLAYLNYKAGEVDLLEMPFDGTDRYWLRVNGHIVHFELKDEYEGQGSVDRGLEIMYLSKDVEDEFWISVAEELTKACRLELPGIDEDFLSEWTNWCE